MKFTSTANLSANDDFVTAMTHGLAPDGGLYFPASIPKLSDKWLNELAGSNQKMPEIGLEILTKFLDKSIIDQSELKEILIEALNFEIPLVQLEDNTHILELFHGPTAAFKDVGARVMARILESLIGKSRSITVITATSGDTGSAVASAFHKVEGIKVVLLYPSGKISHLQELQLTTLGDNITALEVEGTFDDCQALVKQAFNDQEIEEKYGLTTANSINIARLLPQTIYYFHAIAQLPATAKSVNFVIPSGNFGNLTSGLIAKRMGLTANKFIAATNINDTVPDFLETGQYKPQPSKKTHSNAMDVGNPSNIERIEYMYANVAKIKEDVWTAVPGITDEQTIEAIRNIKTKYGYVIDPHSAVGYSSLLRYRYKTNDNSPAIILGTAHPAKFQSVIKKALDIEPQIPQQLKKYLKLKKKSIKIKPELKNLLSILEH